MAIDRKILEQVWVHSHEEDTPAEMVFRPAQYRFPPSRGRQSFELRADGTMVQGRPGPSDRRAKGQGTWTVEAAGDQEELTLRGPAQQAARKLQIKSVEPDRLVVRKG